MADIKIDLTGVTPPSSDGEDREYKYREAVESGQFDHARKVIFINGVGNTGSSHAESALALSWVQMCTVVGVYNATAGMVKDLAQCFGDKAQFNGPFSRSARARVAAGAGSGGRTAEQAARDVLGRNAAQVALFNLLRRPEHRRREVFAHSQGNLILCNALQAVAAVDGLGALSGYTVHTFGSPVVHSSWPAGLLKHEQAFTWDPVTFLAGFDSTWTISKVGMPSGSLNPITHRFVEYLARDPAFVVNRFRWGGLGATFNMDEDGLAAALAEMGRNTRRVLIIFQHLEKKHRSDVDDVAVRYVERVRQSPATAAAVKAERTLVDLLVRAMDKGWTGDREKKAIAFLRAA